MNKNSPKRICGVNEFLKISIRSLGIKKTKPLNEFGFYFWGI